MLAAFHVVRRGITMEILLRIFMFIIAMFVVNVRHFAEIYFSGHKQSKAYYIIFNVICIITFFYMIFIYQGGLKC